MSRSLRRRQAWTLRGTETFPIFIFNLLLE